MAVSLAAATMSQILEGVSPAGLGLASVFSIVIASLARKRENSASSTAGPMFALFGLGGATLPWMVGSLSTYFGILRAQLMLPLASGIAMLALQRLEHL